MNATIKVPPTDIEVFVEHARTFRSGKITEEECLRLLNAQTIKSKALERLKTMESCVNDEPLEIAR